MLTISVDSSDLSPVTLLRVPLDGSEATATLGDLALSAKLFDYTPAHAAGVLTVGDDSQAFATEFTYQQRDGATYRLPTTGEFYAEQVGQSFVTATLEHAVVPEPSALAIAGLAVAVLFAWLRR